MTDSVSKKLDLSGFDQVRKLLGTNYVTRVGILGSHDARPEGELGNADIGLIQEMGSVSGNIPPRSWLRMPLMLKKADIFKLLSTDKVKTMIREGKVQQVYVLIGIAAENIIQQAFSTRGFGQWKPNAPSTIAQKGSSAPLIDTGELRKGISSDVKKVSENGK